MPHALYTMGLEIDKDLSAGNSQRAKAMATLAFTMMASQGNSVTADQVPHLVRWGEQFFRWQMFDAGGYYFKALYAQCRRLGIDRQPPGDQSVSLAGAFGYLAGNFDSDPKMCQSVIQMATAVFGQDHVLTYKLRERAASRQQQVVSGPFGAPTWNMAPPAPPPPPNESQASEALALWVTLAFLRIATADGKVDEREYMVFKKTMQRMQLPDVWGKFGAQALGDMLKAGRLQSLSVELASLRIDSKQRLANILKEVMVADGQIDPSELVAVAQVVRWLGLSLEQAGIKFSRG